MATKNSRAKRETWRDWLPTGAALPTDLYTRDDVVRELEEMDSGPRVTARDLAYWESEGILPTAVRQWHDGAVRAVYPRWFIDLIFELRTLQGEGYNLAQIAIKLRSPWRVYLATELPRNKAIRADMQRTISRVQDAPHESPATADLREALRQFTVFYAGLSGDLAASVEIRFLDPLGRVIFEDEIAIDRSGLSD